MRNNMVKMFLIESGFTLSNRPEIVCANNWADSFFISKFSISLLLQVIYYRSLLDGLRCSWQCLPTALLNQKVAG